METTYDKFFKGHPEQKEIFNKEYAEFLLAESILEKEESERKASKSPPYRKNLY